jgi:hypothetical protein
MPWQSVQTGDDEFPRAIACPWMLSLKVLVISVWHLPHVAGTLNW